MTSSTNTSYTASPQSRAAAENFPVAGWFLSARVRPAVRAYYAFARAADDIADSNTLTVIQKLAAIDAFEASLDDTALGQVMRAHGIAPNNATELLTAFRNDARGTLTKTFADLMNYCRYSAAPVGRFLLALHREDQGQAESDALCSALQILNHVQDCRADAENLKRCYIPLEWLNTAGIDLIDVFDPANLTNYGPGYTPIRDDYTHGDDELPSTSAKPLDQEKLSGCLNLMLNEAETLLQKAQGLPHLLRDRGLTAQSAAILHLAQRLLTLLRHDDPWNYRVSLRMIDWIGSAWVGLRMWIAHR